MMSALFKIDDKHVPLSRILWVSDLPHFCGMEDCTFEGRYEIRLEDGEAVFCNRSDRDGVLQALQQWYGTIPEGGEDDWE